MSLFITNKKKQEKTQKIPYFLPKYFADTKNCRTFASQSRENEITYKQRNPVISILQLATCDATTLPKVEGRNDGKVDLSFVYAAHGNSLKCKRAK